MKRGGFIFGLLFFYVASASGQVVAHLEEVKGQLKLARKKALQDSQGRELLQVGDRILTGARATATLVYHDGVIVRLFPQSSVTVEERDGASVLTLKKGGVWAQIPKHRKRPRRVVLRTSDAMIGIRGTTLAVMKDKNRGTSIGLFEGEIEVRNQKGRLNLNSGQVMEGLKANSVLAKRVKKCPTNCNSIARAR